MELNKAVLAVDKKKMVDIGNYRMDADGNTKQIKVPAHRSQVFLSDLFDTICKNLDDYVRVVYKSTGKLAVMQMITDKGMNPEFSKTTFITDDDLNKSLQYYCERIFEENEDEIISVYKDRPDDDIMPEDATQRVCFKHAKFCEDWMFPDETDTTWTAEMQRQYTEIHGPDPYGFDSFGGPGVDESSDVHPDSQHQELLDEANYEDEDDEAEKDEL